MVMEVQLQIIKKRNLSSLSSFGEKLHLTNSETYLSILSNIFESVLFAKIINCFRHSLFLQKSLSWMFDRVLNTHLRIVLVGKMVKC